MKKAFFVLILFAAGMATQAQLMHYGVSAGLGASYVGNDLLTTTSIMEVNPGAYYNYGFSTRNTAFADICISKQASSSHVETSTVGPCFKINIPTFECCIKRVLFFCL